MSTHPASVAEYILEEYDLPEPSKDPDGETLEHVTWMLKGVAEGYVQGEKAHRWLGYVQGVLVVKEKATLHDMKKLNKGDPI